MRRMNSGGHLGIVLGLMALFFAPLILRPTFGIGHWFDSVGDPKKAWLVPPRIFGAILSICTYNATWLATFFRPYYLYLYMILRYYY